MTQHRMVYLFYFNFLAALCLLLFFLHSFNVAEYSYIFGKIQITLFSLSFSFLLIAPLASIYFGMPNKKGRSFRNKLYFLFIPQRKKSIDLDLPYDFHIPIIAIISCVFAALG